MGDIVASRHVEDRRLLVRRVTAGLRDIAATFEPDLLAPPARTAGDSVVVALKHPGNAYDMALGMDLPLWPDRFRWALASGTVDIGRTSRDVSRMDGPAFHRAATALERARDSDLAFALDLDGQAETAQRVVEWLIQMCASIRAEWTPAEARVAQLMPGAVRQLDVARKLDISPQAIAQTLKRARYGDLSTAADILRAWLSAATAGDAKRKAAT
jgi:hypothetical protein